jgi:hypothetical protein
MKERFIYNSRKEAFEDVLKSFKMGIDYNSSGMMELCFTEMIRDGREDEYWLLKMVFLHGTDNPFVSNWFVKQVKNQTYWPAKCYKLINKILILNWDTGIRNEFDFKTHQEAYVALLQETAIDSLEKADYWLREFIRDSSEDLAWLNSAMHEIGIENVYVKHWFFYQVNLSRFWTKESYDLIVVWAGALTD